MVLGDVYFGTNKTEKIRVIEIIIYLFITILIYKVRGARTLNHNFSKRVVAEDFDMMKNKNSHAIKL